jgi:hypothetical protein
MAISKIGTNGLDQTGDLELGATGNVGIGTSSPSYKLDVKRSGATTGVTAHFSNDDDDLFIINTNSSIAKISGDSSGNYAWGFNSYNGYVASYTNGTERMRIDTNGNVCIGTSTAGAQQLTISSSASGSSETGIVLTNTTTGGRTYEIITGGTGGGFANGSFGVWDRTAGAARMVITSTGITNFYGGGGGPQVRLRAGGDMQIYTAGESYAASLWCDDPVAGMATTDYLWIDRLNLNQQKAGYDRQWDNYPSISVRNDTTAGPQGEFRIHGINGVSGGDYSINLRIDGSLIQGSDARRKTNIEPIKNALDTVTKLKGKKFNIINRDGDLDPFRKDKKQFGFIAQECVDVIPEAVTHYEEADTPNENGWASAYAVDYPSIVALLTEAIKELNEKVKTLEAKLENK